MPRADLASANVWLGSYCPVLPDREPLSSCQQGRGGGKRQSTPRRRVSLHLSFRQDWRMALTLCSDKSCKMLSKGSCTQFCQNFIILIRRIRLHLSLQEDLNSQSSGQPQTGIKLLGLEFLWDIIKGVLQIKMKDCQPRRWAPGGCSTWREHKHLRPLIPSSPWNPWHHFIRRTWGQPTWF